MSSTEHDRGEAAAATMAADVSAAPTVASSGVETLPAGPTALVRAGQARFAVLPTVQPDATAPAAAEEDRLRFEPQRSLGKGGMGEVALARDTDIGRMVAIKHLLNARGIERFAEEIRTIGQLEHPNIPPVHDVGIDERGYHFVMKYVDGETLASIIAKLAAGDPEYRERYSVERRVEIFLGVLHALEFAHSRGVLHRDIKPANIMIGAHGEVMLMDRGVAKGKRARETPRPPAEPPAQQVLPPGTASRPGSTYDGELIGTPFYMSPEQARGANTHVDERSDLYSAAVLFHELLCLKHYQSERTSLPALLTWVAGPEELGPVALGLHHAPGAPMPPAELLHIVAKGLRKDPVRRYQSAGEMIDAVQRALEGRFAVQCIGTFSKRITRAAGRLVDWNAPVALVALVALAGLAGYGLLRLLLSVVH
jgi:eukaryotic-like serine/threonine-protein kinase